MVTDRCLFYIFRERPESVERHIFTQFHGDTCDHQARGQAVRCHPSSSPEKSKTPQITGMEEENFLLNFGIMEGLVDFKGDACVEPVGKGRQEKECVPIVGNVFQKLCVLPLQALVSQRYDAGVDSHKIRLVSNIFTSIPCDWGEVAPKNEVSFINFCSTERLVQNSPIANHGTLVIRVVHKRLGHWEHLENVLSDGDLPLGFHLIAHVGPHWSVILGNHEGLNCVTTGSQLCPEIFIFFCMPSPWAILYVSDDLNVVILRIPFRLVR